MLFDQLVNSILENLQFKYLVKVVGDGFSRRINGNWIPYWSAETSANNPIDAIGHVFYKHADEMRIPQGLRKRKLMEFRQKVKVKKIPSALG